MPFFGVRTDRSPTISIFANKAFSDLRRVWIFGPQSGQVPHQPRMLFFFLPAQPQTADTCLNSSSQWVSVSYVLPRPRLREEARPRPKRKPPRPPPR